MFITSYYHRDQVNQSYLAQMALAWLKPKTRTSEAPTRNDAALESDAASVIHEGTLAYVRFQSGNEAGASYQEAVGAPVESKSPLGYHVNWLTVIFLNINMMVGTGIFSTRKAHLPSFSSFVFAKPGKPTVLTRVVRRLLFSLLAGNILSATGSVGLALVYWVIGFLMAVAGFCTYLELTSYFPNRSGGEVVYLEQAYPRPKHLFPVAFAVQSVLLSFSSSNAVVLSQYLWRIVGRVPTEWEMRGVAVAAYTVAAICELSIQEVGGGKNAEICQEGEADMSVVSSRPQASSLTISTRCGQST